MPFCYKCGKELTPGKPFCKHCGAQVIQTMPAPKCANCGTPAKSNEKYCIVCGHPLSEMPPQPIVAASQPDSLNKGNATGPASEPISPGNHNQAYNAVPPVVKKKKRSCSGCFFKSLIAALLMAVAGILVIYFTTDWLDDTAKNPDNPTIESRADGNDAGIENETALTRTDAKNLDEAVGQVENAFTNADTNQLIRVLTEASAEKYQGVYHEIQPYMKEYASAFAKRKLEKSNSFFALYSFTDETGKKYTAEFALSGDGTWKLVRF